MPHLPLTQLDAHPGNANRMSDAMMDKLMQHIRDSGGKYPPLIVRPHPSRPGRYEILDGHHRAEILRRLGHEQAQCEIWPADDQQAAMLLLTLNRLHGEDDPARRGTLLETLSQSIDIERLARLLPEDARRIRGLIDAAHPPPPISDPLPQLERMPQAVTFFISGPQRTRLFERLAEVCRDRNRAFVELLQLDGG